jgi:hypothetical protein
LAASSPLVAFKTEGLDIQTKPETAPQITLIDTDLHGSKKVQQDRFDL